MHQYCIFVGCQAMGISCSFIYALCTWRCLYSLESNELLIIIKVFIPHFLIINQVLPAYVFTYYIITHLLCFTSPVLIHIPWVLKWSGTKKNVAGLIRIASLHIFGFLRWLRMNFCKYFSMRAASLQISWVLKWLRRNR